jgi:class 3 adenylate cyclase
MDFYELLDDVLKLLHQRGRVTYRTLKLQLQWDDDAIEALKDELIYAQQLAVDEEGRVLVWTGGDGGALASTPSPSGPSGRHADLPADVTSRPAEAHAPEAERRQLTVLFCDLVDSALLTSQLAPEDLREVIGAYQATRAEVIQRFDGHIAQYLGDGLLVNFDYPQVHEDGAQRAARTGLGIVEAVRTLDTRFAQAPGITLAVRLGIHTGLVVVGAMGEHEHQEQLTLGETPNVAASLQGLAGPNTVAISEATYCSVLSHRDGRYRCIQVRKGQKGRLSPSTVPVMTDDARRTEVAHRRPTTAIFRSPHGKREAVSMLPASSWPSPHLLPEGEGE